MNTLELLNGRNGHVAESSPLSRALASVAWLLDQLGGGDLRVRVVEGQLVGLSLTGGERGETIGNPTAGSTETPNPEESEPDDSPGELRPLHRRILAAALPTPQTARKITNRAGLPYNSHNRAAIAELVERGLLIRRGRGRILLAPNTGETPKEVGE